MQLMLTERLVAELLNVSPSTLRKWRSEGGGPPFVKLCGAIRYRDGDLRVWVESCLIPSGVGATSVESEAPMVEAR